VTAQSATTFKVQITIPSATAPGSYSFTVTNPDGGKVAKTITVT
jgi:uncharacterized membrane protein